MVAEAVLWKTQAERIAKQIEKTAGWQVAELRRWPVRGGGRWDILARAPSGRALVIRTRDEFLAYLTAEREQQLDGKDGTSDR